MAQKKAFSLRLSRACLGKMFVFIYKWLTRRRFVAPLRARPMRPEADQPTSSAALRCQKLLPLPLLVLPRRHEPLALRKNTFIFNSPCTFVPSQSWQNVRFIYKWLKNQRLRTVMLTIVEDVATHCVIAVDLHEHASLFEWFPDVCPKPVLAK